MKNRALPVIGLLVAVLSIAFGMYFAKRQRAEPTLQSSMQEGHVVPEEELAQSVAKFEIEDDVEVPEINDVIEEEVAVPKAVAPAAPGVEAKLRSFSIIAENNKYNPSTVIVNVGDTVRVNLMAVDKAYDITVPDYSLKQTAKKGETKILEFQALNEGKYLYYCEVCGGIDSDVKGFIVIVARQP